MHKISTGIPVYTSVSWLWQIKSTTQKWLPEEVAVMRQRVQKTWRKNNPTWRHSRNLKRLGKNCFFRELLEQYRTKMVRRR